MSIYNILMSYNGGSLVPPGGDIGFSDDSPGSNKTFRLPYFNTIKIELWGAGGAGGGGDHNITPSGLSGGASSLNTIGNLAIGLVAGGGGGGIGGNNSGTKIGTGGGGGAAAVNNPAGVIVLTSGNSGSDAVAGQPGFGGNSPNGGSGGAPGSTGTDGQPPGGGGGGAGYDNGAQSGGGKKSGGGAVKDSAGGGGGGSGAYVSAFFTKHNLAQRAVINYNIGSKGFASPAEYTAGSGANGKIRITWT